MKKDYNCYEKVCPQCKQTFMQKRYWQEFCCNRCRSAFHNAKNLEILRAAKENE